MTKFGEIKEKYDKLSNKEKDLLFKDIYNFSASMKLFLKSRLLVIDKDEFLYQMAKETVYKTEEGRRPRKLSVQRINQVINEAIKSKIDLWTMLELEEMAFHSFIDFFNTLGGGPASYPNQASKHLESYLRLVIDGVKDVELKTNLIQKTKKYLEDNGNMDTYSIENTFERLIGYKLKMKGIYD